MAGKRQKAWRNMMVAAINSGIAMGYISLASTDEERARIQSKEQLQSAEWRFELDGIPMLAGASETGYGEIRVTVAAWPTEQAQQSIHSVVSRYKLLDWIGDAYAQGWLERQDGKYLQPSYRPELSCRPERLTTIAALNVEPPAAHPYSPTDRKGVSFTRTHARLLRPKLVDIFDPRSSV